MKRKKSLANRFINLLPSKILRQTLRRFTPQEQKISFGGAVVTDTIPAISNPPVDLLPKYTMNGKIPLRYSYFNDTVSTPLTISRAQYNKAFSAFAKRRFNYYQNSMEFFYDAVDKYPFTRKTVLIYGLDSINCEAFAVYKGAEQVIVVDYNTPICDHEKIRVMTHKDIIEQRIKADIAISFSSFEHDGLGRYGDPLVPDGDLQAMRFVWKHLVDNGLFLCGVPLGKDCIVWNAHRVYGRHRLPLLLRDWDVIDVYGKFILHEGEQTIFDSSASEGEHVQPLMILRRSSENTIDYDAILERSKNQVHSATDKNEKTLNCDLLSEILKIKFAAKELLLFYNQ